MESIGDFGQSGISDSTIFNVILGAARELASTQVRRWRPVAPRERQQGGVFHECPQPKGWWRGGAPASFPRLASIMRILSAFKSLEDINDEAAKELKSRRDEGGET